MRINLIRDLLEMSRSLAHPADIILPIIEECQRDLNMDNHINIYHNIKMVLVWLLLKEEVVDPDNKNKVSILKEFHLTVLQIFRIAQE